MSNTKTVEQLTGQVQSVRDSLARALVLGDPTKQLREYLLELEAQLAAAQRVAAEQVAREALAAKSSKSAAVQRFEAEHPVAVQLIDGAAKRRAALAAQFSI